MSLPNQPGRVYGRLTLVRIVRRFKYLGATRTIWLCECACGQTKEINSQTLRPGKSRSCGCLQTEHAKALGKSHIGKNGNSAKNAAVKRTQHTAKTRGWDYSLTDEYAEHLLVSDCFYCGSSPSVKNETQSGIFVHGGIDRIDSSKGYVLGNVVPACWMCNCMKNKFSKEQFLSHLGKIAAHQAKQELATGRGILQFQS